MLSSRMRNRMYRKKMLTYIKDGNRSTSEKQSMIDRACSKGAISKSRRNRYKSALNENKNT